VVREIDGAEVLAITAVLPAYFAGKSGLAFEIEGAEDMTPILTFDRALARSEKSSFVFRTKYSHFCSSL
jgi:hypothetical protein